MKRHQRCIKCNGSTLWLVDPFRVPGEAAQGHELAVVPHQEGERAGLFAFAKVRPVGRFELWVCASCGYSELWAKDLEALRESVGDGVRLIDASVAGEGPFR